MNPPAPNMVPVVPIIREIAEYVRDSDERVSATCQRELFRRAGVHEDTYYKWINRVSEWTYFHVADKLMTAMGKSHLWHLDPELSEWYWKVDLSDWDRPTQRERWEAAREKRMSGPENMRREIRCGVCKETFTFYAGATGGQYPAHCSYDCWLESRRERQRLKDAA